MAGPSPTQRTLAACRKVGWEAAVVERWNPHARVRHDLFGFIDVVALDGMPGLLAIQATTRSNMSSRVKKIREQCWPAASRWLLAGNRIQVWGWAKSTVSGRVKWGLKTTTVEL